MSNIEYIKTRSLLFSHGLTTDDLKDFPIFLEDFLDGLLLLQMVIHQYPHKYEKMKGQKLILTSSFDSPSKIT